MQEVHVVVMLRVAREVEGCAWRNDVCGEIVKIDHRLGDNRMEIQQNHVDVDF